MSTIVVSRCTLSDAYKADPSLINPGMELISSCNGVLQNYHGVTMKDGNVGFTIQVATSPEDFFAVVSDKEKFGKIMDAMAVTRVGELEQTYINAISDPTPSLAGPVTEINYLTLKEGTPENKAALVEVLTKFNQLTEGKYNWGWTGDNPNKVIVIAAWDSPEAHKERASQPDAQEGVKKMMELCDCDGPVHVKLTKA